MQNSGSYLEPPTTTSTIATASQQASKLAQYQYMNAIASAIYKKD